MALKYARRALGSVYLYNDDPTDQNYTVLIGGEAVFVKRQTLNIERSIGRRSRASFTVLCEDGRLIEEDEQVRIYDATPTLVYSGYVSTPTVRMVGYQGALEYTITCKDQHWLAEKRRVAARFENKSPGYMVWQIWDQVLKQEGVTIAQVFSGTIPSPTLIPGPDFIPSGSVGLIPEANFGYPTVAEAYDALAKQASEAGVPYYWQIDQYKQLWFVPYAYLRNETVVTGSNIDLYRVAPNVTYANPSYRNTQIGAGGYQETIQQVETRKGDGETTAWTMSYALARVPVVEVNTGSGYVVKTVGIAGVDSGKDFYWNLGSNTISQDSGGTKLASSHTLRVTYIGRYPAIAIVQDGSQIAYKASIDGTSGIVESVDQDSSLTSVANSLSKISQLLVLYSRKGAIFEFSTQDPSYLAGTLLTVNIPRLHFNMSEMLVERVVTSDQVTGVSLWHRVTAVLGPYSNTWEYFFKELLREQQQADTINIGITTELNILQQFSASFEPTMSLNATVNVCHIPSPSLIPGPTFIPC